jgi:hypothetical protein
MGRGDGTCTLEALQWIGVAVERRRWAGRSMRSLHGAAVDCGDSTRSGLECVKVSGSGEEQTEQNRSFYLLRVLAYPGVR